MKRDLNNERNISEIITLEYLRAKAMGIKADDLNAEEILKLYQLLQKLERHELLEKLEKAEREELLKELILLDKKK
ncbi:hypothetical protein [Alkaliphilus transvaalensis]|uniref:hypothetical protein n=1 Tax=Alkaliphilus transvaalensis TaxID=114628 RepID=UPI00047E67D7|nr:hypothetical protein [Alkaliphilus transvaalensis]